MHATYYLSIYLKFKFFISPVRRYSICIDEVSPETLFCLNLLLFLASLMCFCLLFPPHVSPFVVFCFWICEVFVLLKFWCCVIGLNLVLLSVKLDLHHPGNPGWDAQWSFQSYKLSICLLMGANESQMNLNGRFTLNLCLITKTNAGGNLKL